MHLHSNTNTMAHALSICKTAAIFQPTNTSLRQILTKTVWHGTGNGATVPQQQMLLYLTQNAVYCILDSGGSAKSSVWIEDLTFFPTFTRWWWLAPLPVGLALSPHWALHHIAHVAGEAHHIIQVKAVAYGAAIDRAAWVTAADGCKTKWLRK